MIHQDLVGTWILIPLFTGRPDQISSDVAKLERLGLVRWEWAKVRAVWMVGWPWKSRPRLLVDYNGLAWETELSHMRFAPPIRNPSPAPQEPGKCPDPSTTSS